MIKVINKKLTNINLSVNLYNFMVSMNVIIILYAIVGCVIYVLQGIFIFNIIKFLLLLLFVFPLYLYAKYSRAFNENIKLKRQMEQKITNLKNINDILSHIV